MSNMKQLIKKILFFLFIIVVILTSLSFAGTEKELSEIICKRIDTMGDFYKQKISYTDAINILSEIEKGRLLNADIDNLTLYYRTDLDRIDEYEITNVKITSQDSSIICAEATILFKIQGLGNISTLRKEKNKFSYSLIFEKCDEKLYLVQFIMS